MAHWKTPRIWERMKTNTKSQCDWMNQVYSKKKKILRSKTRQHFSVQKKTYETKSNNTDKCNLVNYTEVNVIKRNIHFMKTENVNH